MLRSLERADWLDAARARAWRNILLIMSGLAVVGWCALARNGLDLRGEQLGGDFLSFYAASKLVLAGHAAQAYDASAHHGAEMAVFGRDTGFTPFMYPPLFLLLCAPLAALPYLPAVLAWVSVTGAAYLAAIRGWIARRGGWIDAVAFPAVLINLGHGQNGFLSAALLGSGAAWLNRRPLLSGVAFGLLAFKPHLGLLLPVALIASRRWSTLAAAAVTATAFAGLSLWVFGPGVWAAFLADGPFARAVLETGLLEPGKMVSTFAAVRTLGGSVLLAYGLQAVVLAYVATYLVRASWQAPRGPVQPALLVTATLLASPYLLDYDLVILAFPLAWLWSEGVRDGFRPWEKVVLLAGFALPALARILALGLHLPIAPFVLLALFQLLLARAEVRFRFAFWRAPAVQPAAP